MFALAKISAALLVVAPAAQAALFITGYSVQGNASTTVSWTSTDLDSDPALITVELANPIFHNQFGLANDIPVTQGTLTIATPGLIPGDGYFLQLVAISDDSTIYAETPSFTIPENAVVAESSISDGAPSTSSSSTVSSSSTKSASTTSTGTQSSSSGFTTSSTPAATSTSSTGSSAASSSTSPAATQKTNSASGLVPAGSAAAVLAGLFALLF